MTINPTDPVPVVTLESLPNYLNETQKTRVVNGLCLICDSPRVSSRHCQYHLNERAKQVRKYFRKRRRRLLGLRGPGRPKKNAVVEAPKNGNDSRFTPGNRTRYFLESNELLALPRELASKIKREAATLGYATASALIEDMFENTRRVTLLRAGLVALKDENES